MPGTKTGVFQEHQHAKDTQEEKPENIEIVLNGPRKGQCSRGDACSCKHDSDKSEKVPMNREGIQNVTEKEIPNDPISPSGKSKKNSMLPRSKDNARTNPQVIIGTRQNSHYKSKSGCTCGIRAYICTQAKRVTTQINAVILPYKLQEAPDLNLCIERRPMIYVFGTKKKKTRTLDGRQQRNKSKWGKTLPYKRKKRTSAGYYPLQVQKRSQHERTDL